MGFQGWFWSRGGWWGICQEFGVQDMPRSFSWDTARSKVEKYIERKRGRCYWSICWRYNSYPPAQRMQESSPLITRLGIIRLRRDLKYYLFLFVLMVQLSTWDVTHCSNHRLELVVSDAFSLDNSFNDLNTQLADIFRLFRNSGKAKRVITQLAIRMNVMFVNLPKPDGTRFSPHKYNAIKL